MRAEFGIALETAASGRLSVTATAPRITHIVMAAIRSAARNLDAHGHLGANSLRDPGSDCPPSGGFRALTGPRSRRPRVIIRFATGMG